MNSLQQATLGLTRPLSIRCSSGACGRAIENVGPNWFAAVMGTGIVATAGALLPWQGAALVRFTEFAWLLAAAALILLLAATVLHWICFPQNAALHHADPAMAPFYGAPAMAFLTVGSGALLVGHRLIGEQAAVALDWTFWSVGTLIGLLTAVLIPYLMFTRHELREPGAQATWLMPVVPPMVSATAGAALIAHLPPGQPRLVLMFACVAMFGLSLFASVIVTTLLWGRLIYRSIGPAQMVPTLWIVLGPLGQSITAACLLGAAAAKNLPGAEAGSAQTFAIAYGAATWGFAALWLAIAAAVTARAARKHLPFSLTWWGFTFPVGTVVTGTTLLALQTNLAALRWISVALYAGLVGAWMLVAARTLHGLIITRSLTPTHAAAVAASQ